MPKQSPTVALVLLILCRKLTALSCDDEHRICYHEMKRANVFKIFLKNVFDNFTNNHLTVGIVDI